MYRQVGRCTSSKAAAAVLADLLHRLKTEHHTAPMADSTKQLHSAVSNLGKVSFRLCEGAPPSEGFLLRACKYVWIICDRESSVLPTIYQMSLRGTLGC